MSKQLGMPTKVGTNQLDREALRDLLEPLRPTVTTYLPARNDLPDSATQLKLHWSNLRRSLTAAGALDADLDALEVTTNEPAAGGDTNVAIAADGKLQAAGFMTEPIEEPFGTTELIPSILPLLDWEQSRIPHLVVVVDRTGADMIAISPEYEDTGTTVTGDDEYIHRGAPGGWSQRRFQQRAENLWESNAKDVAVEVDRLAASINARAIIVAGDDRAVGFLCQHLSPRTVDLVRNIDGARAEWSIDQIAADTVTQVATVAAADLRDHLQTFTEARATNHAVDGPDAVFQALRRATAAKLYVVDDTYGHRARGWTASDPAHIYPYDTPPDVGVELHRAPLHDIALRSAVLTGADIVVVPAGQNAPNGGVGALLRTNR